ncbi:MAG: MFS transporter [Gloeotrichia echinulata CP02]|jgi:MFS family permease
MEKSKKSPSLWEPLTVRNFLLLFIGENISLLGDQFYLVALPWLTIQLTNSPISLGAVLMANAIPRALLMLIGGVISDRFSVRFIMLISNTCRIVLTVLLTALVISQTTQIWHLYIFAIIFGFVDGFFIPALESIIPTLVTEEQLPASNTLNLVSGQIIMLIGPGLGGLLIANIGVGVALAIDAVTFILSAFTLLLMENKPKKTAISNSNINSASLIIGIREGLNYTWHNSGLKLVLLAMTALNFFFIGPLEVGSTSLANSSISGGALALGTMRSAWGVGGLLGALLPGLTRIHPQIGKLILTIFIIQGFGLFLLGFITNISWVSLIIAALSCCSGFLVVEGITWVQKQTQPELLGRVMSLVMFSSFGITPFSYAMAGLLANLSLTILFTTAGNALVLTGLFLLIKSSMRFIK